MLPRITLTAILFVSGMTVQLAAANPHGAVSNGVNFLADNPAPEVTSLAPVSTAVGTGFTLTVTGTNFVAGAVVRWNGTARTTTYVSATQLTVTVAAADVAVAGT